MEISKRAAAPTLVSFQAEVPWCLVHVYLPGPMHCARPLTVRQMQIV